MRCVSVVVLLLSVPRLVAAWQLWATWDLDVGGHAPPQEFVLTVTSPSGAAVPPPLRLSYQACQLDHPDKGDHCAAIGCPPNGVYEFVVVAVYAEGTSAPSNTLRCTVKNQQCGCQEFPATLPGAAAPVAQQPQAPPGVDTTPPLGLTPEPSPLPQQSAEGLNLQPVGELPPMPTAPAAPEWTDPPTLTPETTTVAAVEPETPPAPPATPSQAPTLTPSIPPAPPAAQPPRTPPPAQAASAPAPADPQPAQATSQEAQDAHVAPTARPARRERRQAWRQRLRERCEARGGKGPLCRWLTRMEARWHRE